MKTLKTHDRMTRARTVQAVIWLHTNEVPAFSDEVAEILVTIQEDLAKKLRKRPVPEDDGTLRILQTYIKALKAVATIGYLHAGAATRGLPETLRRNKAAAKDDDEDDELEVEQGEDEEVTDDDEADDRED